MPLGFWVLRCPSLPRSRTVEDCGIASEWSADVALDAGELEFTSRPSPSQRSFEVLARRIQTRGDLAKARELGPFHLKQSVAAFDLVLRARANLRERVVSELRYTEKLTRMEMVRQLQTLVRVCAALETPSELVDVGSAPGVADDPPALADDGEGLRQAEGPRDWVDPLAGDPPIEFVSFHRIIAALVKRLDSPFAAQAPFPEAFSARQESSSSPPRAEPQRL